MPNEGGVNQFQGFQPEQPYGKIKRLQELAAGAPLPPNSAMTAPERAQRRAARPPARQAAARGPQPATLPAPPAETPYPVRLAQIISGVEGADGSLPNIAWLAQQAATEGQSA